MHGVLAFYCLIIYRFSYIKGCSIGVRHEKNIMKKACPFGLFYNTPTPHLNTTVIVPCVRRLFIRHCIPHCPNSIFISTIKNGGVMLKYTAAFIIWNVENTYYTAVCLIASIHCVHTCANAVNFMTSSALRFKK